MVEEYDVFEYEENIIPILLEELVADIDARKKIVTNTHSFQVKIAALRELFLHLEMQYGDIKDLYKFFEEIADKTIDFGDFLEKVRQGEIHLVLEEEAAEKLGKKWRMEHRREAKKEAVRARKLSKRTIQRVHQILSEIRQLCVNSKHLFSVRIKEAKVKKMKIELTKTQEEVEGILNKLLEFFLAYEHFFKETLNKLK